MDRVGAGLEVVGPVPAGVLGPLHGGVDVEVEQVGEDRCGELGSEADQRGTAGAADVWDGRSELVVEGAAGGPAVNCVIGRAEGIAASRHAGTPDSVELLLALLLERGRWSLPAGDAK